MDKVMIKELEAHRVNYDSIHLMWGVNPSTYVGEFDIFRALGEGAYVKISTTKSTSYLDRDDDLLRNVARYRVCIGDECAETEEDKAGDPHIYEVVSNYNYVMKNGKSGARVQIYCFTKSEDKCPECFNIELNKRIKNTCSTCDGSGMIRGYKGPIKTYFKKIGGISDELSDFYGGGPSMVRFNAWLSCYPLVAPGDIFITKPTERYMVKRDAILTRMVDINNKAYVVKQIVTLEKLDNNHQANKLWVDSEW